eukprot:scaffold63126_cov21-Tisochrysis_lutea.AAC.1
MKVVNRKGAIVNATICLLVGHSLCIHLCSNAEGLAVCIRAGLGLGTRTRMPLLMPGDGGRGRGRLRATVLGACAGSWVHVLREGMGAGAGKPRCVFALTEGNVGVEIAVGCTVSLGSANACGAACSSCAGSKSKTGED